MKYCLGIILCCCISTIKAQTTKKSGMPIIYKQITNIAQYGPEPSSMQKVKEYLLKQYDQVAITNDYWHYVLYNELRYGVDFDKDYKKMVNEITANEIQQMARNIINSNRRIEITMLSKK